MRKRKVDSHCSNPDSAKAWGSTKVGSEICRTCRDFVTQEYDTRKVVCSKAINKLLENHTLQEISEICSCQEACKGCKFCEFCKESSVTFIEMFSSLMGDAK